MSGLVGRFDEAARIAETVRAGGGVLVLRGPAGVGKTRLGLEALSRAGAAGFRTLTGSGRPLGRGLAYAPWLEALGPCLRELPPGVRARLVELPELGRLFGGLDLPRPEPLADPALERLRLFEAVSRLLALLEPVAIFIDDLQWADDTSVELFDYLARGAARHRVLLIAAHRADELTTRFPSLDVDTLDGDGSTALLRELLDGGDPPPALVELARARAGGLPLYLVELVGQLRADGSLTRSGGAWVLKTTSEPTTPQQVRDVVAARLGTLSRHERVLLEVIAVAGEAATHGVVHAVSGLDEDSVITAVLAGRDRGLIAEDVLAGEVRYRPSHPMYGEVAYAELAAVRRQQLHLGVAEALGDNDVELLAKHVRGAGALADQHRALAVCRAAGEHALELRAGDAAVQHLVAALGLANRLARADLVPDLRERLALAYDLAGRSGEAADAWRAAARAATDGARRSHCLRRVALLAWDNGDFAAAMSTLDTAADALPVDAAPEDRLRLHETRISLQSRASLVAEMIKSRAEVAALPGARATALTEMIDTVALLAAADYRGAHAAATRAIERAGETGDPVLLEFVSRPIVLIDMLVFGVDAARASAERGLRAAKASGVPALESSSRFSLIVADYFGGHWRRAKAAAAELIAFGHRVDQPRMITVGLASRALIAAGAGRRAEAAALLKEASAGYTAGERVDARVRQLVGCVRVLMARQSGDHTTAVAVAEELAAPDATTFPPYGLVLLGDALRDAGDEPGALAAAERLVRLAPGSPFLAAYAARLRGDFAEAVARFQEAGMRIEAAHVRLDLAESVEDLRSVLELAEAEDVGPLADRARKALRTKGVRTPVGRERPSGTLTRREVEVARLVAEGLSNAEIAERLFLSRRTVTTHLQHAYARLGVSSRAALTHYVMENGLLDSPTTG
ncbi:ATP-binding protein [Allokutzneria albata]|uniref:AAA ATPase domain-containing protein n=1 Tax=Allokutzneria albata TaxID=211114 RepID=A0A1G9TIB6_ALLAB|nr:helix-turn-helix transcriptional regulator [Allokutzneria albata]SDM47400.1 AAA ATPase domain-containing protein [Allokutzneria albata]